ncbi:hypothetical protein [Lancefieldella parvula]|uniref:hypothetical protein n=1 Tax=Lancefieldella parvula TaxID=1382 RepID=UPI0028EF5B80|nr:hypothetical protein [Lancefieldella parvula]
MMKPNNFRIPVVTERKPTADELYLKALEIRADYIVKAAQVGTLKIDHGPLAEEMNEAIAHYKKLAWKEKR